MADLATAVRGGGRSKCTEGGQRARSASIVAWGPGAPVRAPGEVILVHRAAAFAKKKKKEKK